MFFNINLIKCILFTFFSAIITAHPVRNATKLDLSKAWNQKLIRYTKAAEINALLDRNVDPCQDFYKFSCGNWHRHNPAQLLNNMVTDRFELLAKGFDRRLESILTGPTTNDELDDKARTFFQSCLSVKNDESNYKLALQNVYKEFGNIPFIEGINWNETEFNWWRAIAEIQRKYAKQIIFAVDVMGDVVNNTENRIYLGPPDFAITGSSTILDIIQAVKMETDLKNYFNINSKQAEKIIKELREFGDTLATGGTNSRSGTELKDMLILQKTDNFTVKFLPEFLKIVLDMNELPEYIYIYDQDYLDNVIKIIADKPKRVVANYIYWQFLNYFFINADKSDLSKWCIEHTKKYFGKYLDHMVYKSYRNEKLEEDVFQVWNDIRETFRNDLKSDKHDWISDETRKYAIEKLDAMSVTINSYDDVNFTAIHGNLQIDSKNFIKNLQNIFIMEANANKNRYNEKATTLEDSEVLSYTPAYNLLENEIKIPVALLQPHYLWGEYYPQALKYGTLGYLLAHEMIHGFDDDGRNYDKKGNQAVWWNDKSKYEYEARRKCFQAQYSQYKYGGKFLPDSISQSENIADNGGIKIAYKTYQRWLKTQPLNETALDDSENLPDLYMNKNQLFFVSFAQLMCDDVQSLLKTTIADKFTHAPSAFRIIGSLSNYQEFSWVFQCAQNAEMDPEFKCSIY